MTNDHAFVRPRFAFNGVNLFPQTGLVEAKPRNLEACTIFQRRAHVFDLLPENGFSLMVAVLDTQFGVSGLLQCFDEVARQHGLDEAVERCRRTDGDETSLSSCEVRHYPKCRSNQSQTPERRV